MKKHSWDKSKHNRRWRRMYDRILDSIDLSWLEDFFKEMKIKHNLPEDSSCGFCLSCKERLLSNEDGLLYCGCKSEF